MLGDEFNAPYMTKLRDFLLQEKQARKQIYQKGSEIFAALNLTPLDRVKVVVIGQDPYHGPGQAHGLSFSVLPGVEEPPSLKNILKEIGDDIGARETVLRSRHGCLIPWAKQCVLLLNAVLTVEHRRAASHQGRGWETFTDKIVAILSESRQGLVFMLWGSYAQRKGAIVNKERHLVLNAPHPSPLSAHRGFFGCKHFSKANQYLAQQGREEIDWLSLD